MISGLHRDEIGGRIAGRQKWGRLGAGVRPSIVVFMHDLSSADYCSIMSFDDLGIVVVLSVSSWKPPDDRHSSSSPFSDW